MTMPRTFIGVDVSKQWIDAHHLSSGRAERVATGSWLLMAIDANHLRDWLAEIGATRCIPPRKNRKVQLDYDVALYKTRNIVERMWCLADQKRGVAGLIGHHDPIVAAFSPSAPSIASASAAGASPIT